MESLRATGTEICINTEDLIKLIVDNTDLCDNGFDLQDLNYVEYKDIMIKTFGDKTYITLNADEPGLGISWLTAETKVILKERV